MQIVVDGLIYQKDPHGGIARLFRELLPRVCELDDQVRVTLLTDGRPRSALPLHARIQHRQLPNVRPLLRPESALVRRLIYPFRRAASKTWNFARQGWIGAGDGAIWHSTFYTQPPFWQGAQVVTVYDLALEHFPHFFNDALDEVARQQKERCIRSADAILCISTATRDALQHQYSLSSDRLHVIHLAAGAPFRVLGPDPATIFGVPHSPFLLYTGSRVHYKNFGRLLEAFAGWERRFQAPLVCIGPPWQPAELDRIRRLQLVGQVTQLNAIDDGTLCRLYNRALALVYPSLDEGFGLPLLEAMRCACPIVASHIASTREVAGDIPIYFDPTDTLACRAALDQAWLENRSSARVAAGIQWAERFTWERTAQQTLEVYRSLLPAVEGVL